MRRVGLLALVIGLALLGCTSPPVDLGGGARVVLEDGSGLYHRTVGAGESTLLVPGASWLEHDLGPLTESRRVVFCDLRGRGRSSAADDPADASLERDLADLEALRERLGLERFALFGWWGNAALALRYALEHPERVERLVLVAPLPARRAPHFLEFVRAFQNESDAREFDQVDRLREAGLKRERPEEFARAYTAAYVRTFAHRDEALASMRSVPWLEPNLDPDAQAIRGQAIIARLGSWDWRAELEQLQVPTLVVHGTEDLAPLAGSAEIAELLPKGELLAIEAAGRLPWLEEPAVFFPALEAFLAQPSE